MQIESPDTPKDNPWLIMFIGILLVAFAWFMHSTFTNLEQAGGSIRINWIFALAYKLLGKWPIVILSALIGLGVIRHGWSKLGED